MSRQRCDYWSRQPSKWRRNCCSTLWALSRLTMPTPLQCCGIAACSCWQHFSKVPFEKKLFFSEKKKKKKKKVLLAALPVQHPDAEKTGACSFWRHLSKVPRAAYLNLFFFVFFLEKKKEKGRRMQLVSFTIALGLFSPDFWGKDTYGLPLCTRSLLLLH